MTNAIRHGKAGSVRVEIFEKRRTRAEGKFKTGPALHLTIQDDGHGIGADTPAGFGLTVMRERIHALGGSFIIESAPARGTTLLIIFPIQNRTAEGSKLREGRAMQSSRRAGLDRLQIPRRARRSSRGQAKWDVSTWAVYEGSPRRACPSTRASGAVTRTAAHSRAVEWIIPRSTSSYGQRRGDGLARPWVRIPPSPPKVVARQGLQDDFDFQSINRSTMVTLPLRPRNNAAVT